VTKNGQNYLVFLTYQKNYPYLYNCYYLTICNSDDPPSVLESMKGSKLN